MKYLGFALVLFLFSCGQHGTNKNTHHQNDPVPFNDVETTNSLIHIVWRTEEIENDTSLSSTTDTVSEITVNTGYCKTAPDAVKAAIGFAGTFIGSDCDWDGPATDSMNNLSCKLISSLGLGYQCSEKHLGFLRHWLRNEPKLLKELEDCPIVPFTASAQNTFDNMDLMIKKDTIIITYAASGVNMPMQKSGTCTGQYIFRMDKDELHLILEKETKPEYTRF